MLNYKLAIKSILYIFTGFIPLAIISCSNSSGGNGIQSGAGSQLVVDTVSPVPLVNSQAANYSVYIKNVGVSSIHGLSFGIAATKAEGVKSTTSITLDASNCNTIAANSSCKINITTDDIGVVEIEGSIDGKKVLTFSTSTYPLTVTNSGDKSNALILVNEPSTMILQPNGSNNGSYFGAMSLSVINSYGSPIDVTKLLGTLPTNMTWSPINCPNPLPFAGVCQVRLTYNGPSSNVTINLRPSGEIINTDGTKTPLPAQNSSGVLGVTNTKSAILNVAYPSLSLDGHTPNSNNTTIGYITNNGTAAAVINDITINNNTAGIFSIIENDCNGQLAPNSICKYKITGDVGKLSAKSSGVYSNGITVSYNNGLTTTQSSGQLSYSYIAVIAPANLNLSIHAPSVLNQTIPSSDVMITNNSNVVISNLSTPTLSGGTSHVILSDPNNCSTKSIAIGGSCNYVLTFTPQAPSETNVVSIGEITASYSDPVSGSVKTNTFTNTASVNLNSQFAGVLELSGVQSLNSTTTSGTITVTNSGNQSATLGNIQITSSGTNNISKTGGSCAINQTLAVNGTCTIIVGIQNTTSAGSGTSNVMVTYNNHNGITTASAASNVSWVIGDIPSLSISFGNNALTAVINQVVTTTLTITNNGNNTMSNIQLPVLSNAALSYVAATTNACNLVNQQLSGQHLTQGSSCKVVLQYAPTTAFSSQSVAIGAFSGIYQSTHHYISNIYSVTLAASSPSQLSFTVNGNPIISLSPSLNWTNNSIYSQSIIVHNSGNSPITNMNIDETNDSNGILSTSGCPHTLAVDATCTLIINGNYPTQSNSFISNGSVNFSYSDAGNNHNATLPVTASIAMLPVVSPNLQISGTIPSTVIGGEPQTIMLTLTNNSGATNNGNTALTVNMNSLIQNIGTNLSGGLNTIGIVNNACSATSGNISLSQNQSCNVNLVLMASGSPSTTTATIAPQYQYSAYNTTSMTPNQTAASGVQLATLSGSITIQARSASLNLGFYTNNTYDIPISNLFVEQGLSNPTAVLKVTNLGTTALTSIVMPAISGFTLTPDPSCSTLAPETSCNINVVLSSSNIIAPVDITKNPANIINFTYSNHQGSQNGNTDLPTLTYQVTAPSTPSISVLTSVTGCGSDSTITGSNQTCNLNPGSTDEPGIAGGYKFVVTYTNSGSGAAVITAGHNAIGNYATPITDNCNGVTLAANTGSCTVIYGLSSPTQIGAANVASGFNLGSYSYTYGSQNQLIGNETAINPNQINVNITEPSLNLSLSSASIQVNGTTTITGTISSWYAGSVPGSINVTSGTPATAGGATITCTGSGSGGCTGSANITGSAPGTTNLNAGITTPDGTFVAATPIELSVRNVLAECAQGLTIVELETNISSMPLYIQLSDTTPITKNNFLQHVTNNSYNNSVFHRLAPGFVIQGGGFYAENENFQPLTGATIQSEGAGISNTQYTIAMARNIDPNSASTQFFINLVDNSAILDNQSGGYTAFGVLLPESYQTLNLLIAEPVADQSSINPNFLQIPYPPYEVVSKADVVCN